MKVPEMVKNVAFTAVGGGVLVGGVTIVTLATFTLSHALYASL